VFVNILIHKKYFLYTLNNVIAIQRDDSLILFLVSFSQ
jgi:hypothetical protein